jgi:hypothetical protein
MRLYIDMSKNSLSPTASLRPAEEIDNNSQISESIHSRPGCDLLNALTSGNSLSFYILHKNKEENM